MPKPDLRPLYMQVRSVLLERIESGSWRPGVGLPSEFALADELGVSQGTVRKALDSLARDHLVVRRQGSGTFVAEQTPAEVLFRFFKIYRVNGDRVLPDSAGVRIRQGAASRRECGRLNLRPGVDVIRISRIRLDQGTPFIREQITLPADVFPGLAGANTVPNTLYDLFQREYGVTVARADERLEPVVAGTADARALEIEVGTPLLKVDRIAIGLNERPIEWRVSLCHLKGRTYLAELG